MTQVSSKDGRAVYFPARPRRNARADDTPNAIFSEIDPNQLHRFARRLIQHARRRRHEPAAGPMNVARLKLARLCIDHIIIAAEGDL